MNRKEEYKNILALIKKQKKEKGEPYRNEDIARELGITRTYLSDLTTGSREVTDKHIKDLKLHYPDLGEKSTNVDNGTVLADLARSSVVLAEANKTLADANMILATNNQKLTDDYLNFSSGSTKGGSLTPHQIALASAIEKMAEAGAGDLWKSKDAGILKLGKLLVGDVFAIPK